MPIAPHESIGIRGVGYSYGRRAALTDISVSLTSGITCLLGPNGAGKSTLMNILATIRTPSVGEMTVGGELVNDVPALRRARQRIGYLPQKFDLMRGRTVWEHLTYAAWAHGTPVTEVEARATRALRIARLQDLALFPARRLSGGQRQRLGLGCALAHDPDILLLDEPTVGLDPDQARSFRDELTELRSRTVLLCTHVIGDAAAVADRILILNNGRLTCDGSLESLTNQSFPIDRVAALESVYSEMISGRAGRK